MILFHLWRSSLFEASIGLIDRHTSLHAVSKHRRESLTPSLEASLALSAIVSSFVAALQVGGEDANNGTLATPAWLAVMSSFASITKWICWLIYWISRRVIWIKRSRAFLWTPNKLQKILESVLFGFIWEKNSNSELLLVNLFRLCPPIAWNI